MKHKNKKMAVIIAGVLVIIVIFTGIYTVGAEENKENKANSSINQIEYEIDNQTKEIKNGSLIVTIEDNGYLKVKSDKAGKLMMKASKIKSESKGEVECQYVIKWHTLDATKETEDKDREIQDLGVIVEKAGEEFYIAIPENAEVENEKLGIKVYIAIQEIDGKGFKSYEEINMKPELLAKPETLNTFGKIDGDDGMGFITMEYLMKGLAETKELTPKEQQYRDYEIKKYTQTNSSIDLETDEEITKKAKELRDASESEVEFIDKVYELIKGFEYDYELLEANKDGRFYLPEISKQYKDKKAICVDSSWIVAKMLRSQGVPTKIVDGIDELEDGGHSWNEVLINGQWIHIDATATRSGYYGAVNGYKPMRIN